MTILFLTFIRDNAYINFPPQPCTAPRMCVANESSVEQLALLDGLKEITSALSCHCLDPRPPCHRKNNIRVFHWGTTYKKGIDIGQCVGSCNKGILHELRLNVFQ